MTRLCVTITAKAVITILTLFLLVSFTSGTFAQEEALPPEEFFEGRIENVLEEKESYQKLEILITNGLRQNEKIEIEVGGEFQRVGQVKYKVGDKVVVSSLGYITDFVRQRPLVWLFAIFVALVILIGRFWGTTSLLGMGISFLVIFKIILPQILAGHDPVLITILGSLLIIPATFYLSHGFNRKTTVAIGGTLISLVIAGLLSKIFVELTHLTGYASDEASFLRMMKGGAVNIKGLLLAGMIVGVLGVLDDITVAQAAVVEQLRQANPNLRPGELFNRAMKVGQDHIASMVNTLVLVYTGASLPLLLLFVNNPQPFSQIINYEIIAGEIVRTLVGSIALILAVPTTTFLSVNFGRPKS